MRPTAWPSQPEDGGDGSYDADDSGDDDEDRVTHDNKQADTPNPPPPFEPPAQPAFSPRAPPPPSFLSTASPSSRSGVPLAATPSALRSLAPKATLARRLPSSRPLSRPSLRAPPPSFLSAAPPSSQSGVPLAPSALRPLASEATLARCRPSSRSLSRLSLRAPPSFQPARTKGLIPSTTAIATATWCRCAFRFYVYGLYFADLSSCVHVSGRYTPYRIRHSRSLSKISAATGSVITR